MAIETTLVPAPASVRRATANSRARWAPLPVLLAGTFMMVLDFFIVNVALPSVQATLHASSGSVEWIVAGYGLATAMLLIAGARAGDRWGRRRVLSLGLALFTASSAVCGLAGGPEVLVAARFVQGGSAGLVGPNVLSIIGVLYDGDDRPRALAAYGLVMGIAAVLGQLIGGLLVQADIAGLGWRSCFAINVPIGALALALAPRTVPESRAPGRAALDLRGTALATAALTAVVLPLVDGRAHGWPLWSWASLACAPLLLAALVVQQRRLAGTGGTPLLPPALFGSRAFTVGLAAQLLFWAGQASYFLILSLYLQQGRGWSALHAGLVFTILAVSYLATSLRAPQLTIRHGRRVLALGAGMLAAGHVAMVAAVAAVGTGGSALALVPGLALAGAGMGLGITPLTTLVMASTGPAQAGAVAAALTTMQNVGAAVGVAVVGALFYGELTDGVAPAFELGVGALAVALAGVVALARLLPARAAS